MGSWWVLRLFWCLSNLTCLLFLPLSSCTPGYTGVKCEEKCSEGSWGSNCIETCSCSKGTTCHHVTGECLPCAPGLWGEGCKEKCRWANLLKVFLLQLFSMLLQDDLLGAFCWNFWYDYQKIATCSRCDEEGTELCGHTDGRCFCKGNRFHLKINLLSYDTNKIQIFFDRKTCKNL